MKQAKAKKKKGAEAAKAVISVLSQKWDQSIAQKIIHVLLSFKNYMEFCLIMMTK